MRKLFWCCTAAGVVAAGGVFTAAHYTCCHPESVVARGLAAACTGAPLLPEIPTPYPDCCAEECADPAPAAPADTPAPAPIVINEDCAPLIPCPDEQGGGQVCHHAALCPAARAESADLSGPTPAAYEDEHSPVCPMVMPYCTDEDQSAPEVLPLPREQQDAAALGVFDFWMGWFGITGPVTSETSEPPADDAPRCEEDRHYYEHFSGCPYTGASQPARRKPPAPAAVPLKGKGEDDCCQPPQALKIYKALYNGPPRLGEDCPRHPEVDTMEYRRSDGGLNEFGAGPY
jgi:hypothetical protein